MPNLIPSVVMSTPELGARASGRPPYASMASAMGSALNALCGFHLLRHGVMPYQLAAGADDATDAATLDAEPAPARWRRTSAAQYVWAGIWLLAEEGKGVPSVELELQLADGTTVDGPIEWSVQNNYLPVSPTPRDVGGLVVFGESRDAFVQTGWSTRPITTLPRLLSLDAADPGAEVQLCITDATAVRIYSVGWAEAYVEQLG